MREEGKADLPSSASLPQIAAIAVTGPSQNQEMRAAPRSPIWGPRNLGHPLLLSWMFQQEAGSEMEKLELQPVPIWNGGIASSCLMRYDTTPALSRNLLGKSKFFLFPGLSDLDWDFWLQDALSAF